MEQLHSAQRRLEAITMQFTDVIMTPNPWRLSPIANLLQEYFPCFSP